MQYLPFDTFLDKNLGGNAELLAPMLAKMKRTSFKKGDFLLRQGSICKHSFFVESGLLKYYSIDEKGKVHVLQFAPEGWFVSDRDSSFFNEPSPYFIDAMEDSTVLVLEYEDMCQLTESLPEFGEFNNRLLHKHIRQLQSRINLLLSASAEERYQAFIRTYPDLLLRVPQHLVASYLGITPEGLSRVRKELAAKHFKK